MIEDGRKSKCLLIIFSIVSSDIFPVPKVSTEIETGFATPMAYESCISIFFAISAATRFFAMYRAA